MTVITTERNVMFIQFVVHWFCLKFHHYFFFFAAALEDEVEDEDEDEDEEIDSGAQLEDGTEEQVPRRFPFQTVKSLATADYKAGGVSIPPSMNESSH